MYYLLWSKIIYGLYEGVWRISVEVDMEFTK